MKSYNLRSLRGETDYDDKMFQDDMRQVKVDIPDDVLFTPDVNKIAAEGIRQQNIVQMQRQVNPETGANFTVEEATDFANKAYANVLEKAKALAE